MSVYPDHLVERIATVLAMQRYEIHDEDEWDDVDPDAKTFLRQDAVAVLDVVEANKSGGPR